VGLKPYQRVRATSGKREAKQEQTEQNTIHRVELHLRSSSPTLERHLESQSPAPQRLASLTPARPVFAVFSLVFATSRAFSLKRVSAYKTSGFLRFSPITARNYESAALTD
jgi:hypothetical protein